MSKVYVVIRGVNEESFPECIESVENLGFDYVIFKNDSSLEDKSKACILLGSMLDQEEYDWVLTVDADVLLTESREWIEKYCDYMKKITDDKLFCFTGYLNCTKRETIDGMHFFRTKYCKDAYRIIKNIDFSYHLGREEYEICRVLKDLYKMMWTTGYSKKPFGIHLFEINNKIL